MVLQQNLKALAGIVIDCLGGLIGITGAADSYYGAHIILDIDDVVELRLEVIFMAPGITIGAGKLTAIIRVGAIAAPEPAIDELVFIEDGLKIFSDVFNQEPASPRYLLFSY